MLSVKMALATALHHSAQRVEVPREEVEGEVNDAPQRQKPPPPGTRPAPLGVVPVPQGFLPGAPRQPGSGAPSLFTPALADTTADGVDAGALAFLTRAVLEAQKEEARRVQLAQAKAEKREQRVRRQEMVDELAELCRAFLPSQSHALRRAEDLGAALFARGQLFLHALVEEEEKEKEEEKATVEGVFKDVMVLWVLAEEYSTWIFLGDGFWIYFRVQLFPWCHSGYMLRQSTAAFVRVLFVFSVMLGSTLDTFSLVLCCRVVVKVFLPIGAYGSTLDSVMPMKGKHIINYLQYHEYGFGRPSLEREVQLVFVFIAPVAELNVVSFTVPLNVLPSLPLQLS